MSTEQPMKHKNIFYRLLSVILLIISFNVAAEPVASITVVVGVAKLKDAATKNMRALKVGDTIQVNDEVITEANAKVKVVLLDKTVLDLGENSVLVVDRFVLGDSATKGAVGASFKKGLFRYVSGQIAKSNGGVELKVPDAVITVRGTEFEAFIDDSGIPGQTPKTSVLLDSGAITLRSGNIVQEINQPGFVADVQGLGKISKPVENRRCL